MRLDDISARLRSALLRRSGGDDMSGTEFRRVVDIASGGDDGIERDIRIVSAGSGTKRKHITLVPMRSLSLEDFTFPFSNSTKIREALRLQVLPFSAAGNVELFPVTLSKTGRISSGIVWYVSPDELDIPSLPYDSGPGKIWPAPLPFVSQLESHNGTGVTMWLDEGNVCSLLWQEYKPVLYRWRRRTNEDAEEKELAWYNNYCKIRELERGGNFVVNAAGDEDNPEEDERFCGIVSKSVNICPWISGVNLSRSALEGAMGLERNVRLLTRAACWLLALGVIALGAGLLRWQQVQDQVQAVRDRAERYYKQVFDPQRTGRVSNPVVLARDRIAELSGTGTEGHPLEEVLADLGDVFTDNGKPNITIDTIRYNADGIDCTGVAPDMSTILAFRRAWEDKANLAQVDNTQFVSGIGYRFDLRVRW